jgi:predicted nucleic acid-binding protein
MAQGMSLVADTSVWVDYFKNVDSAAAGFLETAIAAKRVIVPDLVLLETLRGAPSEAAASKIEVALSKFEIVTLGGSELAVSAAKNYRILRAKGVTIRGSIGLLIGTWCIANDMPLLQSDREFTPMEQHLGLKCVTAAMFQ